MEVMTATCHTPGQYNMDMVDIQQKPNKHSFLAVFFTNEDMDRRDRSPLGWTAQSGSLIPSSGTEGTWWGQGGMVLGDALVHTTGLARNGGNKIKGAG